MKEKTKDSLSKPEVLRPGPGIDEKYRLARARKYRPQTKQKCKLTLLNIIFYYQYLLTGGTSAFLVSSLENVRSFSKGSHALISCF